MFLDIIADPNWYTTMPTEPVPAPVTSDSPVDLIVCIVIILVVTIVMFTAGRHRKNVH